MDRLHLMSVFVAVAEAGGFAAGARRLGLSAPAVTRAVASLEEHLGVRLLSRTTRVVRVTDAGALYLDDCRRILADVAEAEASAGGATVTPRGHLAITAPALFGRLYVMPVVAEYLACHEEVSVSALLVDRVVGLVEEGLDAGLRIGELPSSSLRALRVGEVRRVLCASPAYLRRAGAPRHPRELPAHPLIAATGSGSAGEWRFREDGAPLPVRVAPRLQVTTNDAAVEAAVAGVGIARLLSYQVAAQLAEGSLLPLLVDFEPAPMPVHVVHREGRHAAAKVRAFVDLLVERLRAHPGLARRREAAAG